MSESVIINLPFFPGFYESMLSGTVDNAEEREAENSAEKEESKEYYPETYQPEELRLDSSDYAGILFDCMNYSAAYQAMAADYCDAFDNWAADNLETPRGTFKFESMDSPREYNFRTDRVYVTAPLAVMEKFRAAVDVEKLREEVESRHKSRSGFISFYSDDVDSWLEKPLDEFDHNELGTLLCATMAPHIDGESDFNWELCAPLFESDYEYVDQHCDWDKFAEKARELRAEKLAAWIASDAEAAARYVAHNQDALAVLELALAELDSDDRRQWEAMAGIQAARFYRCPFTMELPFPAPIQTCQNSGGYFYAWRGDMEAAGKAGRLAGAYPTERQAVAALQALESAS